MAKTVMTRRMLGSCAKWVVASAALVPALAHAQSATPPVQAAEPESNETADIVVTAQRREERLQDVPQAIVAVGSAQLDKAVVNDVTDLSAVVAGLRIANANGQVQPRLRGVVSTGTGPGVENSTAIYIDGVYLGSTVASLLSLSSIERLEVLKGPQGTLFGRNSTGGLLNIITRSPTVEPAMNFTATYGNYGSVITTSYVTGGSGNIAADLAVYYRHQGEGFGRNITTGNPAYTVDHDFTARSKIVFEPSSTTKLTLSGDYTDTDNSLNTLTILEGTKGLAPLPPTVYPNRYDTSPNHDTFARGWQYGGSLRWDQGIGDYSLMTLTAYRKSSYNRGFDFDGTQVPIVYTVSHQPERQFSQEIQLLSPSNRRFTWVVGAYYFNASSAFAPLTQLFEGPFPPAFTVPTRQLISAEIKTESIAGFAQGTLKLGDRTNFTAGIRYTDETKSIVGSQSATLVSNGAPLALPPITRQPDVKIGTPSYRVSLDHHFTPDIMVYASFNRSFKSGGFAAADPGKPGYRPETLDAYEAGVKITLLGGQAHVNAAAFHYEYKDIQIQTITAAGTVTANGPAARINGLELDFDFRAGRAFSINGGLQIVDDKFTNYPAALISSAGGGVPLRIGSATGNRLPLASRFIANLSPQYSIDLGGRSALDLSVAYSYNSGWYPSADNVIRQPAFSQVNASIRYVLPGGHASITAWGKNLSNERIFSFEGSLPTGGQLVNYAPPRTYGVTLGAKF